jgi:hypothetical protein
MEKLVTLGIFHLHDIIYRIDACVVATLDNLSSISEYYEQSAKVIAYIGLEMWNLP